jgi:hypothetical protein
MSFDFPSLTSSEPLEDLWVRLVNSIYF